MELTIKGTPDEIKNVLQAISGSEEHEILEVLKQIREDHRPITREERENYAQSLLGEKKLDFPV